MVMERAKAADLPDGTVVASATADVVYVRNRPSQWTQWRGTNGSHVTDTFMNGELLAGAVILRVGRGEEK